MIRQVIHTETEIVSDKTDNMNLRFLKEKENGKTESLLYMTRDNYVLHVGYYNDHFTLNAREIKKLREFLNKIEV